MNFFRSPKGLSVRGSLATAAALSMLMSAAHGSQICFQSSLPTPNPVAVSCPGEYIWSMALHYGNNPNYPAALNRVDFKCSAGSYGTVGMTPSNLGANTVTYNPLGYTSAGFTVTSGGQYIQNADFSGASASSCTCASGRLNGLSVYTDAASSSITYLKLQCGLACSPGSYYDTTLFTCQTCASGKLPRLFCYCSIHV